MTKWCVMPEESQLTIAGGVREEDSIDVLI
jgi:hypothetical protein